MLQVKIGKTKIERKERKKLKERKDRQTEGERKTDGGERETDRKKLNKNICFSIKSRRNIYQRPS